MVPCNLDTLACDFPLVTKLFICCEVCMPCLLGERCHGVCQLCSCPA